MYCIYQKNPLPLTKQKQGIVTRKPPKYPGIFLFYQLFPDMASTPRKDGNKMKKQQKNVPLATEIIRDYQQGLQDVLESLDVYADEIAKIQKQLSTFQKIIRIDKNHIREIIGEQEVQ